MQKNQEEARFQGHKKDPWLEKGIFHMLLLSELDHCRLVWLLMILDFTAGSFTNEDLSEVDLRSPMREDSTKDWPSYLPGTNYKKTLSVMFMDRNRH